MNSILRYGNQEKLILNQAGKVPGGLEDQAGTLSVQLLLK